MARKTKNLDCRRFDENFVIIFAEYHSVCPLVGIRTLPPSLSPASVPLPLAKGGEVYSPGREGLEESQSDDWRKSLAHCLLCDACRQLNLLSHGKVIGRRTSSSTYSVVLIMLEAQHEVHGDNEDNTVVLPKYHKTFTLVHTFSYKIVQYINQVLYLIKHNI